MRFYVFSVLAIVLLIAGNTVLAEKDEASVGHQPGQYIGYYHDGSGVFPDASPVTRWNETDFRYEKRKDHRGRETDFEVPGAENRKNIVYKVPHYNWCNGGMIIAGSKLFALADRGGLGFYAEKPADFAGAKLFCIDPATGKELWTRDLHPWDLLPNGEAFRKKILDYNEKQQKVFGAYLPMGSAMRGRHGGKKITPEEYLELAKPLRDLIPDLPETLGDIKGHIIDSTGYPQLHFWGKVQPKYWPEIQKMRKEIQEMGYLMDPWGGCGSPLGLNMQTPVSDGKYVYVSTSFGAVFCVDLKGKMKWKKWFGGGMYRAPAIPSPVLAGDLLVVTTHDPNEKKGGKSAAVRMALKKDTGEVVWTAKHGGSYQTGPIVMDLPIKGQQGQTVRVLVYNGDGVVLRASDGQQLASGLPAVWTGRPWQVDGEIIVFNNRSADGGGASNIKNEYKTGRGAMRLVAESRDRVVPEILWQGKKFGWGTLVARDGVLFHMDGHRKVHGTKEYIRGEVSSYDLKTGEQIAKVDGPVVDSFHYTILAGDYLIGLDTKGFSGVAKVSRDGKALKAIGINRLGTHAYNGKRGGPLGGKFSYGCQPFASGNRLFIRSMTHLYCIGDPEAKMVLSPAHR